MNERISKEKEIREAIIIFIRFTPKSVPMVKKYIDFFYC